MIDYISTCYMTSVYCILREIIKKWYHHKKATVSHPSNELSFLVHADVVSCLCSSDTNPAPKRVCLHDEFGYKQTNKQWRKNTQLKKATVSLKFFTLVWERVVSRDD